MQNADKLNIPPRIKVGYQTRNEEYDKTYTGKLAYVIYFDRTGKLRKETSWDGWRDKKLGNHEFDNVPTEGFVLNKGVGGVRQSSGWNARNEYIRVYDPRDFEFEISVTNLLFILRECDCYKGKGLAGKFVYAWHGTGLVLLPESCEDYKASRGFTDLQGMGVKAKALVVGTSYRTKKNEFLTYIGRYEYFTPARYSSYGSRKADQIAVCKKYIFWDGSSIVALDSPKTIAKQESDVVSPELPELTDKYLKSQWGSRPVRMFLKEVSVPPNRYNKDHEPQIQDWYYQENSEAGAEGTIERYANCTNEFQWVGRYGTESYGQSQTSYRVSRRITFANNIITIDERGGHEIAYAPHVKPTSRDDYRYRDYGRVIPTVIPWKEPVSNVLCVELESGSVYKVGYSSLEGPALRKK